MKRGSIWRKVVKGLMYFVLLLILSPILVPLFWPPNLNSLVIIVLVSPYFGVVLLGLLLMSIGVIGHGVATSSYEYDRWEFVLGLGVLLFIVGIILGVVSYAIVNEVIAQEVDVVNVDTLPATNLEYMRVLPRGVADRYVNDSINIPQYRHKSVGIMFGGDGLYWQYAIVPDGFNWFFLREWGYVNVRADVVDKRVNIMEREREIGMATMFDISFWLPLRYGFGKEYSLDDMYYFERNGSVYVAIPVSRVELRNVFLLVLGVKVPDGVVVVDEYGNSKYLTLEEAREDPVMGRNPIVAEGVARYWVEIVNWRNGFINLVFFGKDVFEIADPPQEYNRQPYLLVTEDGGTIWLFAVRPRSGYGIYKIFYMEAGDGNLTVYQVEYGSDEALLGPVVAMDYVRKELPIVDWNTMVLSEPIPIVLTNTLYWNVRVVPKNYAGVTYIALVNAHDGSVKIFDSVAEVRRFVSGGEYVDEGVSEGEAVTAVFLDLVEYVVDGNSRFVVRVEVNGTERVYLIRAEEIGEEGILVLLTAGYGDEVELYIVDGRVVEVRR